MESFQLHKKRIPRRKSIAFQSCQTKSKQVDGCPLLLKCVPLLQGSALFAVTGEPGDCVEKQPLQGEPIELQEALLVSSWNFEIAVESRLSLIG